MRNAIRICIAGIGMVVFSMCSGCQSTNASNKERVSLEPSEWEFAKATYRVLKHRIDDLGDRYNVYVLDWEFVPSAVYHRMMEMVYEQLAYELAPKGIKISKSDEVRLNTLGQPVNDAGQMVVDNIWVVVDLEPEGEREGQGGEEAIVTYYELRPEGFKTWQRTIVFRLDRDGRCWRVAGQDVVTEEAR